MFTQFAYQAAIKAATRSDPDDLGRDFARLSRVHANLPAQEEAYWTLPRSASEWRLPADDGGGRKRNELLMLPVRDEYYANNAYLAVVPQPIIMHHEVAQVLEHHARNFFKHYPIEDSLARRQYDVPMLIGRFDVIVDKKGDIQICELDDVCSLWPALPKLNPIAATYLHALEDQMGLPIYTAELFQYSDGAQPVSPKVREMFARISYINEDGQNEVAYIPRSTSLDLNVFEHEGIRRYKSRLPNEISKSYYEQKLIRKYLHNEDHWNGDISDAWLLKREEVTLGEVALSVRAYREMPDFAEHLDRYGPRSITMAWGRDSKWSLVAENLAVLAANLDVATEFGNKWQADHPDDLLVFKTLYCARTEHTAIFSSRGTKLKGVSSASQIKRKFGNGAHGPIIIQPYKEPDSLAHAGVQFIGTPADNAGSTTYTDRKLIRGVEHVGSPSPGERVMLGMENHFTMIFRSFVVYLPKEKRLVHIGGLWQATDGRIVHGGAHSVAGPLYIDGLMSHGLKGGKNTSLKHAEAMLRKYGNI